MPGKATCSSSGHPGRVPKRPPPPPPCLCVKPLSATQRGTQRPSPRPSKPFQEIKGGNWGGEERKAALPMQGLQCGSLPFSDVMPVSCFCIAVCSLLAGKSLDQSTESQDNHGHYLAIYFPRIHLNWSNDPASKFQDFWLFRPYCSPLPPGRPPLRRRAQVQETAPAGGSNVGPGRGRFRRSAPFSSPSLCEIPHPLLCLPKLHFLPPLQKPRLGSG